MYGGGNVEAHTCDKILLCGDHRVDSSKACLFLLDQFKVIVALPDMYLVE